MKKFETENLRSKFRFIWDNRFDFNGFKINHAFWFPFANFFAISVDFHEVYGQRLIRASIEPISMEGGEKRVNRERNCESRGARFNSAFQRRRC